jgi:hypothetical protein
VLRRVVVVLLVLAVIAAGVVFGMRAWWGSDDPRARVQALLSQALQRDVAIGGLEVQGEHVVLTEVAIGNPEGFEGEPLFRAARIELDVALEDLLDDEITGVVHADAVDLHVVKKDGKTNLLGPFERGSGDGRPLDLHLDLAITASRLVLDDLDRGQTLVLEGVGMRVLLSNRDGAQRGEAHVTIAEVGLHGIPLRDVELFAKVSDDAVELEQLEGRLGAAGRVKGHGQLWLGGDKGWTFVVSAADVDIDGDVRPLVTALFPPLAATVDATAAKGKVAADVALSGTGLHWAQIRPTLAGKGNATLTDVELPAGSLVPDLAALVGHEGAWSLAQATAEFTVADDWVKLGRVTLDRDAVPMPVEGGVSLAGALDLRVDVLPLARLFGGKTHAAIGTVATSLPVRVRGTVSKPELAWPTAADVGRSLLGGAIRRSLAGGDE